MYDTKATNTTQKPTQPKPDHGRSGISGILAAEYMLGRFSRMLDLNHPQTDYIFAAARLEDAVLECAKRIVSAQPFERTELLASCERSIDAMRTLNSERFGSSASVASAIDELHAAMRSLAASASPDMSIVRPAFTRLESDEGFGTVWI